MSKRILAIVVGAAISLTMASPAAAQQGRYTGSSSPAAPMAGVLTPDMGRGSRSGEFQIEFTSNRILTDAKAASELHKRADVIAKCVVRRGGDAAPTYLGGGLVGDPDYQRIGEALNGRLQTCVDNSEEATAIAISGSLAEQLLAAQSPQVQDRASVVNEDVARSFFGDLAGAVTLDNIAGCVAVYSPGLAYKVLQAPAGSSQEAAALEAAYKQTPECGITATPSSIPALYQRGALATALYKWTNSNG